MSELEKFEKRKKITKYVMITLSVLFVSVMLVLPLVSIVTSSLKEGLGFYIESVTKSYVLSALKVTLIATVIAVAINTFSEYVPRGFLPSFLSKESRCLRHL